MNSSLYIGATGMKGLAEAMQVTTNNIANVSTIGYKQQGILFSDILYQTQAGMGNWWNAQEDSRVAVGQVGMGLQVESIRTMYQQGGLESSNTVTDMAISGKGFFQVTDDKGGTFYTRAGDFRPDNQGVWRTPTGLALMGYQIGTDGTRGALAPVQVDNFATIPAKTTSRVELTLNLNSKADKTSSAENPYFALLNQYNGSSSKPLATDAYTYSQPMTVYDAQGNARTVTAYFDGAPSDSPNRYMEFIIAENPTTTYDEDGNPMAPMPGDGLLMSGVLQFDAAGNLQSVAAFTPTTAGSKNLEDWVPARLSGGLPQFSLSDGATMTLDLGVRSAGGWENAPQSAADVGTDMHLLPNMGESAIISQYPTTSFTGSTPTSTYVQDGYSEGYLSSVSIRNDGTVVGLFSNNESLDLWQIPICRFTSEDGLRREGGNLFSATPDAGQMEMGVAGTENYGTVQAYNIELSNVDMATEMVNMIVTQRGFQSNSKVVTTSDQMLQKAMELKRS